MLPTMAFIASLRLLIMLIGVVVLLDCSSSILGRVVVFSLRHLLVFLWDTRHARN